MTDIPEKKEKKESKNHILFLSLATILLLVVLGIVAGGWFYAKNRNDQRERSIAMGAIEQRFKSLEEELVTLRQTFEQTKMADRERWEQIAKQVKVPANMAALCAEVNLRLGKEAFAKANIKEAQDLVDDASSCLLENFHEMEALKAELASAAPLAWDSIIQDLWALNDDVPLLDSAKKEPEPKSQIESGWRRFWNSFKAEVAKLFVVEDDTLLETRARLQLYLSATAIFAQTHDVEKTIALLDAVNALLVERFDIQDQKVKALLAKSATLKNNLGSPILRSFDQAIATIQNKLKEQAR
jgi:uncharacterized protein HemX